MIDINKYRMVLSYLGPGGALNVAAGNLLSVNHYYILKARLGQSYGETRLRHRLAVRKADDDDMAQIRNALKSLDADSRRELLSRLFFYMAGFRNCYVAASESGDIAYLQWLIYPSENPLIRRHFHRRFHALSEGEVMVENAFTFPRYRGFGILPAVTPRLLELARQEGCSSAVGYIRKDRISSLNEFMRMGFKITRMVREVKVFGVTKRFL